MSIMHGAIIDPGSSLLLPSTAMEGGNVDHAWSNYRPRLVAFAVFPDLFRDPALVFRF